MPVMVVDDRPETRVAFERVLAHVRGVRVIPTLDDSDASGPVGVFVL